MILIEIEFECTHYYKYRAYNYNKIAIVAIETLGIVSAGIVTVF